MDKKVVVPSTRSNKLSVRMNVLDSLDYNMVLKTNRAQIDSKVVFEKAGSKIERMTLQSFSCDVLISLHGVV